jgi:hypothetical protein
MFAWLDWAALVIGIVSATPAALLGLLAWLLWTVVVSILLFQRGARAVAVTTSAASS